jgi:hypothetical protein
VVRRDDLPPYRFAVLVSIRPTRAWLLEGGFISDQVVKHATFVIGRDHVAVMRKRVQERELVEQQNKGLWNQRQSENRISLDALPKIDASAALKSPFDVLESRIIHQAHRIMRKIIHVEHNRTGELIKLVFFGEM